MNFEIDPIALDLGQLFSKSGFEIALVGGSVRDLFLKKTSYDLDFTTNALPADTKKLLRKFCDNIWSVGEKFGTIGGIKNGVQIEVTTYRTDKYEENSRKPLVEYGTKIEQDLSRRDFTVNAIAIKLPEIELIDPFGGISDLASQILRTPIEPQKSFSDDPLRMMRAVRFMSTLGFKIEMETVIAITQMSSRIEIISKERVRDELTKLLLGKYPARAIDQLVASGLNRYVIPELDALQMQIDPAHHHKDVYAHSLKVMENAIEYEKTELSGEPDLILRLAALLHDIGKPATREFLENGKVTFQMHDAVGAKIARGRLKELRFSNDVISRVSKLIELHMRFYGYGEQGWTDGAVRRYVNDAGDVLNYLHIISRSDVTTKNEEKAQYILTTYEGMMKRIDELKEQEELKAIRPDLNGFEIMEILGLSPGYQDGSKIGAAYDFLLNWRIEDGPHSKEEATEKLKQFAKENLK